MEVVNTSTGCKKIAIKRHLIYTDAYEGHVFFYLYLKVSTLTYLIYEIIFFDLETTNNDLEEISI